MATNEQVYTTRILLNSEQAKNEIVTLQKKVDELRKVREEAWDAGDVEKWKKLGKEIEKDEKKIVQMEGSLKSIDRVIDNMSAAGPKQLKDTIKAINKMLNDGSVERGSEQWQSLTAVLRDANAELKKIKDEQKAAGEDEGGGVWEWLKKFNVIGTAFGSSNGITQLFGKIIGKVSELTTESIGLAQAAEGIEMAFARIDKPGLLDNLRQATHGTVDDLELMKQAVKFEDFNLPVGQLGTFLAYAQQKAKDTSESIDYLVNSIVTGLGRQSLPILDNLGLSATEIREEMKSTGDMTTAVANIIAKNMGEAGAYTETTADRAAQATARQRNAMLELGREILPLKENIGSVFTELTVGATNALTWLVKHRKVIYTVVAAVAAYTVAVNASIIATKAQAAATWLAEKAQKALNLAQKANLWGLLAAGIAAAVTAIIAFVDKTKEANRCVDALNHAQEEANNQYVEQESRIRTLDKVLHDNNTSLEERRSALMRLKEIIPGYNAMLSKEGELINDNRIAIEEYLKSLKKEIMMKVYKDEMADLYKQQRELEKQRQNLISGYQTQSVGNGQTVQTPRFKNVQDLQKYTQLGEEILDIENTINDMMKTISKASVTTNQTVEHNREYWEEELQERTKYYNSLKKDSKEAADALRSVKEAEAELAQYNNYKSGGNRTKKETDPYETDLKTLEENQKQAQYVLRLNHEEFKISDEEYYRQSYESEMKFYQQKLELQERYSKSTLDTQNAVLDRIASETIRKQREQQQQLRSVLEQVDASYKTDQIALTQMYLDGTIATEKEYNDKKLEAEIEYYRQRLAIIQQYGGDAQEADAALLQKQLDQFKADKQKRQAEMEKAFKEATTASEQNAINDSMYAQDLISFEQYQQRKEDIAQESADRRKKIEELMYQEIRKTMQSVSSLFSALQSAEVAKVESRYDKQIEAARKAGKNTTKLEKQKEKEVAAIKSKYADREFQMKVLEITADTAVGIAKLWKNPGYPWAIPLTALVAAQGAIQLATAEKAREQAQKGYYEGGFTGGHRYRKEVGVVHEGEFVANHETVANPSVRPLLEYIDQAQKSGTISQVTEDDVKRVVSPQDRQEDTSRQKKGTKRYTEYLESRSKLEEIRLMSNQILNEQTEKETISKEEHLRRSFFNELVYAQTLLSMQQAYEQDTTETEKAIRTLISTEVDRRTTYISEKAEIQKMVRNEAVSTIRNNSSFIEETKQQQAQEAGYYEGGFTGGRRYRKEAGVVHEGEFVANHEAVQNPAIMPFLNFLDQAQRNNTVGSLTSADVSRSMGAGGSSQIVAPIVNVQTDNEELREAVEAHREATEMLLARLERPIDAQVVLTGPDGLNAQQERLNKMLNNK